MIGSQSTGKSSVLETIMGKEILPRGKGIVTRSPIEIQLIRNVHNNEEWIEFADNKEVKVTDFTKISSLIQEQTDSEAGQHKGITEIPIRLKFYSPFVLNLLMIDLPGLTKNPVGDQPKDIEEIIRNKIIMPYISNPNSIILAVSKANDDIANSESLKMAREVDPEGNRTIGVLTQVDLMDRGTDVYAELNNATYKLKLGYVGVVCRGSADVSEGKTLKDQLETEREFFENHPTYNRIARRMGIPHLINKLNGSFIEHIKMALPGIRDNIASMIKNKHGELERLGRFYEFPDESSKGRQILTWIQIFCSKLKEIVNGVNISDDPSVITGGARINHILFTLFINDFKKLKPSEKLTWKDICSAILNCMGINSPLIVPEQAFYSLIKTQINDLRPISLAYSQEIYEEMRKIIFEFDLPELKNYPNFRQKIRDSMETILEESLQICETTIKTQFEVENSYININHPDFIQSHEKLKELIFMQEKEVEEEEEEYDDYDPNSQFYLQNKKPKKKPEPTFKELSKHKVKNI